LSSEICASAFAYGPTLSALGEPFAMEFLLFVDLSSVSPDPEMSEARRDLLSRRASL